MYLPYLLWIYLFGKFLYYFKNIIIFADEIVTFRDLTRHDLQIQLIFVSRNGCHKIFSGLIYI